MARPREGGINLSAFEQLVRRLAQDIPEDYLDGVGAIDVSPRAVPHPVSAEVFTLGECIPVHADGDAITSRIVLYHGSFRALARLRPDFDWKEEAWETLTHELRHHLEWRANADALEEYDRAADHNFARLEGRPFDPLFFQGGEEIAEDIWKVDDDLFIDRVVRRRPARIAFPWHGTQYAFDLGDGDTLPLFVIVEGVDQPPLGELVVVVRRKPGLFDLFRKSTPQEVRRQVGRAGA